MHLFILLTRDWMYLGYQYFEMDVHIPYNALMMQMSKLFSVLLIPGLLNRVSVALFVMYLHF